MEILKGSVRTYAWGSRTHLAELLGGELPSPHPQAELWLGAHRDEPSRLGSTSAPLTEIVLDDTAGALGPGHESW